MSVFTDSARAALEAGWPAGRVYAPGGVPKTPVTPYVVMYADAGRDETVRLDATAGSDGYRLMPMVVGKTEDEISRGVDAVRRSLRNKPLSVAGYSSTPIAVESTGGVVRDPDGGALLSLTLFLTFNAYPTESP